MVPRIMRLPEEIKRPSTAAHHKLLNVITLVSPCLLSHILTNPSSSPVMEMLGSKLAQLYKGESWHFKYLCLREKKLENCEQANSIFTS